MAQAMKLLEGRTISYPYQVKKPNMESSMFSNMQQQMKQRGGNKAIRERQLLIVCMEHEMTERTREE
eukprot:7871705-Ditylum_brightwellii.AAC.1